MMKRTNEQSIRFHSTGNSRGQKKTRGGKKSSQSEDPFKTNYREIKISSVGEYGIERKK